MRQPARKICPTLGFTLIELMIVVAILPILFLVLSTALGFYPRFYAEMEEQRRMSDRARATLTWLGRDIRTSRAVLAKAGSYATDARGTLVLARQTGGVKLVVWSTQDGTLQRLEFSDAKAEHESGRMVMATSGPELLLSVDKPPPSTSQVEITVRLSHLVMDRKKQVALKGLFSLRRGSR